MYGRRLKEMMDLLQLPMDKRVNDDAKEFAEHMKKVHDEVR